MKVKISKELQELAEIFKSNGEELYIVGGYIRDAVMGAVGTFKNDVDLCSACRPNKLVKMLKNTKFLVDDKNAKYGTIVINGQKRYEHTTFRRENYNLNGEHNPTGIEFIKDLSLDARRRDFTINAIYYNILKEELVDPVNGVEDIKNKILRTTINSNQTFKEDSERILRMIRFACTFNFEVEEKTLQGAVKNSRLVANLSKQRLKAEFDKMLICDTFYPKRKQSEYAHVKCLVLIGYLNLWQYIFPAINLVQKCSLVDEKGEHVYDCIMNTMCVCEPEVRLAGLFFNIGKVYAKINDYKVNKSLDWADVIIENNLGINGLGYSKKETEEVKKIIAALSFDKYGFAPKKKVKFFIRENVDVLDKICMLKNAIALENTNFTHTSKIADRWIKIYRKMLIEGTPLNLADLNLDGNDILEKIKDVKENKIGEILNSLLDYCLMHPECNEKDYLLEKTVKMVVKKPNYYFE